MSVEPAEQGSLERRLEDWLCQWFGHRLDRVEYVYLDREHCQRQAHCARCQAELVAQELSPHHGDGSSAGKVRLSSAPRTECQYQCVLCGTLVGGDHRWEGCRCVNCGEVREQGHEWQGCTCNICGKVRAQGHHWHGCVCSLCGEVRDAGHDWNGCTCRACGRVRREEHAWQGCTCALCGSIRNKEHDWDVCVCRRCRKRRHALHRWRFCECTRCGYRRDTNHDWLHCHCRTCGRVRERDHPDHAWQYSAHGSGEGRQAYVCRYCHTRRIVIERPPGMQPLLPLGE